MVASIHTEVAAVGEQPHRRLAADCRGHVPQELPDRGDYCFPLFAFEAVASGDLLQGFVEGDRSAGCLSIGEQSVVF